MVGKLRYGVEIYEGDIIKYYSPGFNCGGIGTLERKEVKYTSWGNHNIPMFDGDINRLYESSFEIIGNICETPELLDNKE